MTEIMMGKILQTHAQNEQNRREKMRARIGDAVKAARKKKRWTRIELYKRCGVAPSTIGRIENGGNVTLDTLIIVLAALDLDIAVI